MRRSNLKKAVWGLWHLHHTGVCDGLLSADTCSVWSLLSEQLAYDYFLHRINYWNGILYIDTVDM
mgnify:CR=1 FL=1